MLIIFWPDYPEGWIPTPRQKHQAFCYDGKVFFFGGVVNQIDESRKGDFIEIRYPNVRISNHFRFYYTNELLEYDPKTNRLTRLQIRGDQLTPRIDFAMAVVGDQVYIHGGWLRQEVLNDFYALNMKTLELEKIEETGYMGGVFGHNMISILNRYILFTGGFNYNDGFLNNVKIFDTKERQWKEEEPLSPEIGLGLYHHRTVKFSSTSGDTVLCVGGLVENYKTVASHMVAIDLVYQSEIELE